VRSWGEYMSEYLEKLYSIRPWHEDPFTEVGLRRFQESLRAFQATIDHPRVRDLLGSRRDKNC